METNSEATIGPDTIVRVRRHWNNWKIGGVPLGQLTDFRWDCVSGGVGRASPHMMVYAYMWCDQLVSGEIGHSCAHGPGPHRIKVVVVQKDNDRGLIKEIQKLAGPRPAK